MENKESRDVFSLKRWREQLITLSGSPDKLDIDTWVDFLYECCNLFKVMGSAMSMAFSGKNPNSIYSCNLSDVTSKAAVIKDNKEFHTKEAGLTNPCLQDIIEYEISISLHILNGENNSKKLDKSKKTSWEYKYTSTTRTVLRNLWLFDFLHILMKNLHED